MYKAYINKNELTPYQLSEIDIIVKLKHIEDFRLKDETIIKSKYDLSITNLYYLVDVDLNRKNRTYLFTYFSQESLKCVDYKIFKLLLLC